MTRGSMVLHSKSCRLVVVVNFIGMIVGGCGCGCGWAWVWVWVWVWIDVWVRVLVRVICAQVCTYGHTCAHLCTSVHMTTCVHTCAYMCTCEHTCAHTYVRRELSIGLAHLHRTLLPSAINRRARCRQPVPFGSKLGDRCRQPEHFVHITRYVVAD